MKYVIIDEAGVVISDVKELTSEIATKRADRVKSVEGMNPYPSINDSYDTETDTWTQGTRMMLGTEELQEIRDGYLKSTDWIIVRNLEGGWDGVSGFDITEWNAFRAALRNIDLPAAGEEVEYTSSLIPVRPAVPTERF